MKINKQDFRIRQGGRIGRQIRQRRKRRQRRREEINRKTFRDGGRFTNNKMIVWLITSYVFSHLSSNQIHHI